MAVVGGGGGAGRTATTSATTAIALHLLSFLTLASAYFLIVRNLYSFDLVSHPAQTLRILTVSFPLPLSHLPAYLLSPPPFRFLMQIVQAPVVIGSFSWLRRDPQSCSVTMHATCLCLSLSRVFWFCWVCVVTLCCWVFMCSFGGRQCED